MFCTFWYCRPFCVVFAQSLFYLKYLFRPPILGILTHKTASWRASRESLPTGLLATETAGWRPKRLPDAPDGPPGVQDGLRTNLQAPRTPSTPALRGLIYYACLTTALTRHLSDQLGCRWASLHADLLSRFKSTGVHWYINICICILTRVYTCT